MSTTEIVFDIDRCLQHLKRCVRLNPDGTVKVEGEATMTREQFSAWIKEQTS